MLLQVFFAFIVKKVFEVKVLYYLSYQVDGVPFNSHKRLI